MVTLAATQHDPGLRCKPCSSGGAQGKPLRKRRQFPKSCSSLPTTSVVRVRRDPSHWLALVPRFVQRHRRFGGHCDFGLGRSHSRRQGFELLCDRSFYRLRCRLWNPAKEAAPGRAFVSVSDVASCSHFASSGVFRGIPCSSTISPAPVGSKRRPCRKC
jgi:hypothetical protein